MAFNINLGDAAQAITALGSRVAAPKAKMKNAVCVAIDLYHSRFDFFSVENDDASTARREEVTFRYKPYSAEFLTELTEAARGYAATHPFVAEASVTVVLPNSAVAMDTINIPNMNRRRNADALDATISGLFKNHNELLINHCTAAQNKHLATYSLTILSQKLFKAVTTAMTEAGMTPTCITFAANATATAASLLCPDVKNASYLLLDIKHHTADFVFIAKGRAAGYYSLPFGYSICHKNKVQSEDMLFDHSVAELAVLNAREKAKAKQLTIMREEALADDASEEEHANAQFGDTEGSTADPTANVVQTIKSLPKKQPRKLPKFMQRPQPKTDEEYGYENFRIFIKWALNLLQSNEKLAMQGAPEVVYVNMPHDLEYLFEIVNAEMEQNKIEFRPLQLQDDREEVIEHLELYGGLYAAQGHRSNIF